MSTYKIKKALEGVQKNLNDFSILEPNHKEPEQCGGLFFRVAKEAWMGSDGSICFRFRMRPLKSKSCSGCWTCSWLLDDYCEYLNLYNSGDIDIQLEQYFNHGTLVQLKVTHVSTDWETGVVDDYEIDFVEVKDEDA